MLMQALQDISKHKLRMMVHYVGDPLSAHSQVCINMERWDNNFLKPSFQIVSLLTMVDPTTILGKVR